MRHEARGARHEAWLRSTGRIQRRTRRGTARFHEGESDHVHEMSVGRRGELVEYIWKVENVALATVGIDIGSSTSHLMFATVRLQRKTQALSSQFIVVERRIVWKSPILLTPFLPDGTIDAAHLGRFIARCYEDAGLASSDIDTGAVILTGEAIKRANARAIADLFAEHSGRFVTASAGHGLECVLAAHGSGAAAISREESTAILNVDVGGGTTKMALVSRGEVLATCAFAVGGRVLAFDAEGRVARVDEPARLAAARAGVALEIGDRLPAGDLQRIVEQLADAAISLIRGDEPAGLARDLLLTEPMRSAITPAHLMFSGGVSEYIYGRETRAFGDIAQMLAQRIALACRDGRIATPLRQPREGIRATVIGASQFTVQVSGKTIHVSEGAGLPLRNVPVIAPAFMLDGDIDVTAAANAIRAALARSPADDDQPIALSIRWRGDPEHKRLRALAEAIVLALAAEPRNLAPRASRLVPLILMIDGDVGRTLGHILEHELAIGRAVISIDGIQLKEFDFVDIGALIQPAEVVTVVIKSLLFSGAGTHAPKAPLNHPPSRLQ